MPVIQHPPADGDIDLPQTLSIPLLVQVGRQSEVWGHVSVIEKLWSPQKSAPVITPEHPPKRMMEKETAAPIPNRIATSISRHQLVRRRAHTRYMCTRGGQCIPLGSLRKN